MPQFARSLGSRTGSPQLHGAPLHIVSPVVARGRHALSPAALCVCAPQLLGRTEPQVCLVEVESRQNSTRLHVVHDDIA
eukprot:scaffold98034_cov63-Phaeocystis_antarctica.AAC.3